MGWTQFDHTYSKFVNLSQLYYFLFYIISILRSTKKFLAELMNQLFLNMIDQLWWYCRVTTVEDLFFFFSSVFFWRNVYFIFLLFVHYCSDAFRETISWITLTCSTFWEEVDGNSSSTKVSELSYWSSMFFNSIINVTSTVSVNIIFVWTWFFSPEILFLYYSIPLSFE